MTLIKTTSLRKTGIIYLFKTQAKKTMGDSVSVLSCVAFYVTGHFVFVE